MGPVRRSLRLWRRAGPIGHRPWKEGTVRILIVVIGLVTAALSAAFLAWKRDPRTGSAFVNSVVNPWLLRRGLAGGRHSEIGSLEHIGRTSGTRRVTLVHPELTPSGFRVMVPLGTQSEWARNVLTAGRCRLQLHEQVYELADPQLVPAGELRDLRGPARTLMGALGFRYLTLRTVAVEPGTL